MVPAYAIVTGATARIGARLMTLDRRHLLKAFAMTGLVSAVGASAAKPALFFDRIKKPIGLQLYTLGDEPGKDLDGVFARLASIGYRDLQLPSLFGKAPAVLKAAADKAGVAFSCLHLPLATMGQPGGLSLLSEPSQIADALGILGIKSTVAPIAPFPANFRPNKGEDMKAAIGRVFGEAGPDLWKKTAAELNEKAAKLKPFGIALGYHNHNIEFAPIGKTTGWDILARETDPKLVHFEIDIGWVAAGGLDPVAFLKRHNGRVRWMHVKDLKATTKTNYVLSMDPTEVGSGKLDWSKILPAAHKAGVQHFYVEQEPPFEMARMAAAEKSFGYLAKLVA
jgi:sugar phosphate isomerase/epimerase